MKKYKIGYTQGVYDMFHIGHLNLLNNAKEQCEVLIVGINADALVEDYKKKKPVINQEDRKMIVSNIRAVDSVIIVNTLNKYELWKQLHFDAIFIGADWKGNSRWIETEQKMTACGVDVVFLPHTEGISSTQLRPEHENKTDESERERRL